MQTYKFKIYPKIEVITMSGKDEDDAREKLMIEMSMSIWKWIDLEYIKDSKGILKVREFLKEYDKTKEEHISFEDLQKQIKMPEKILRKYLIKMLEDGEIYEPHLENYRWLG